MIKFLQFNSINCEIYEILLNHIKIYLPCDDEKNFFIFFYGIFVKFINYKFII